MLHGLLHGCCMDGCMNALWMAACMLHGCCMDAAWMAAAWMDSWLVQVIGVDCSGILEQAQQIIEANGFKDQITLVQCCWCWDVHTGTAVVCTCAR
jgi:hypothetical protein